MAATTRTRPKPKPKSARKPRPRPASSRSFPEVLTLSEAAEFLRVAESEVETLAMTQALPGRKLGAEWRFLKSALEDWLRRPVAVPSREAMLALSGSWKDDPSAGPLLEEIYRRRGRPMVEGAK